MVQLSKIAAAIRVANARRRPRDEAKVEAWREQAYPEIQKLTATSRTLLRRESACRLPYPRVSILYIAVGWSNFGPSIDHDLRGLHMSPVSTLAIALGFALVVFTTLASASGEPSSGAKGMPGALGTFEFRPTDWMEGTTTWWKDSDGVDPGTPGCHIGTDEKGEPNGRMFGEACLPDGMLVESNPGTAELHSHKNDIGHPDKFDCNAWCVGTGYAKGTCVAAAAPPCEQSAACKCE